MPGPGEYLADVTEGITRVEDLPKAKVIIRSRNYSGSHTDHIQNPTCLKKPLASLGERVCKA
jgi:hypothetical protein